MRSRGLIDRSRDERDSIVLMGSARSGTTWLAEVLDRHHDHRLIFEPLRPGTVPRLSAFANGQYLRPADGDDRYVSPMRELLQGRIRNPWSDHLNRVWISRQRLIKEIRANLLAPWIIEQFPGVPVVMIVRHPLAVAVSRRELGWSEHLDTLLAQHDLVEDHLGSIVDRLGALDDQFRRGIAQWAIETVVPLRMTDPGSLSAVSYEQLVTEPATALERILPHVRQQPDAALDAALDRPSKLARADSAVSVGADRLGSFRKRLDPDDESAAQEVLELFGLDSVYPAGHDAADLGELSALHAAPYELGSG